MALGRKDGTPSPEHESWDPEDSLDPLGEVIRKYIKNQRRGERMLDRGGIGGDRLGDWSNRSVLAETDAMDDDLEAFLAPSPPPVANPADPPVTSGASFLEELSAQDTVLGLSFASATEIDHYELSVASAFDPQKPSASSRGNPNSQASESPKVCLTVARDAAQIGVRCLDKPGLLSSMSYVLEKHGVQLVSVKASSIGTWKAFILNIRSNGLRPDQMLDGVTVEEIYKRAAEEIASSL